MTISQNKKIVVGANNSHTAASVESFMPVKDFAEKFPETFSSINAEAKDFVENAGVEHLEGVAGRLLSVAKPVRAGAIASSEETGDSLSMSILKQTDGSYHVVFRDMTMYVCQWCFWKSERGAVLYWLHTLSKDDVVNLESIEAIGELGTMNPWFLQRAASFFSLVLDSPATINMRITGAVGGLSSYVALAATNILVYPMGSISLAPIGALRSDEKSRSGESVMRPFINDVLIQRGIDKGILLPEEAEMLRSGEEIVQLSNQQLVDRGFGFMQ